MITLKQLKYIFLVLFICILIIISCGKKTGSDKKNNFRGKQGYTAKKNRKSRVIKVIKTNIAIIVKQSTSTSYHTGNQSRRGTIYFLEK